MITDVRKHYQFEAEQFVKVNLVETAQLFCDLYCFEAGQAQPPRTHDGATKFYYVLEGTGLFTLGDEERHVSAGGFVCAEPGVVHGVSNAGPARLVALVTMAPNPNV
jgi:quercetin dioxygenase-like cupin family protein